jgi:hypothetical protein
MLRHSSIFYISCFPDVHSEWEKAMIMGESSPQELGAYPKAREKYLAVGNPYGRWVA